MRNISSVGAAHSHYRFFEGVHISATIQFGDGCLCSMFIAFCHGKGAENGVNYIWIANCCKALGLHILFNKDGHIIFADRHKGIPAFTREFLALGAHCCQNLLKNCSKSCMSQPSPSTHWYVLWLLYTSETNKISAGTSVSLHQCYCFSWIYTVVQRRVQYMHMCKQNVMYWHSQWSCLFTMATCHMWYTTLITSVCSFNIYIFACYC